MKKRVLNSYAFSIFCFVLASANANAAELTGTPDELRGYLRSEVRMVTISEDAEEIAYTDIAKIRLVISTKAKKLATAIKQNNELRQSIRQELNSNGIEDDSIRSSKYSASPQFGWFGNAPNSYEIVNNFVISVDEEDKFRGVAEIADQYDEVRFAAAEFEHSEKEAFENLVRDSALAKVMKSRDYFAKSLGLTLSPVLFSYSDVQASVPGNFAVIEEIVTTASRAGADRASKYAPKPSFDEVTYHVSVSVTFEVEAKK